MVSYSVPKQVIHQGARERFNTFVNEHHEVLSDYIIQKFLGKEAYYKVFVEAICFPTQEGWERLDQSFHDFYTTIRLTDYISKTLWRYAKDYRAKSNRNSSHYLLILDQPLQGKDQGSETTFKDQLATFDNDTGPKKQTLLEEVENQKLYYHLKTLTCKQRQMLDLYYLHGFTQREISNHLNVSQQSVSKTINVALKQLKSCLKGKFQQK